MLVWVIVGFVYLVLLIEEENILYSYCKFINSYDIYYIIFHKPDSLLL